MSEGFSCPKKQSGEIDTEKSAVHQKKKRHRAQKEPPVTFLLSAGIIFCSHHHSSPSIGIWVGGQGSQATINTNFGQPQNFGKIYSNLSQIVGILAKFAEIWAKFAEQAN